ncbi:MAG: hypothetical protein P0119_09900 [Nitrospira sp.]|nr:hypothetical protein [Nitrospira sp.]
MPHVLTACHDPGHALVMALYGDGVRHHIYLGGRRMIGAGAHSTEDYLSRQESAFKAHFLGLQMDRAVRLDDHNFPDMMGFLQRASTLSLITGIPSGRGNAGGGSFQSVDRLVKAIGDQRYALLIVAEPLDSQVTDTTLDICRRLKSDVHMYTRRTISQMKGENESQNKGIQERANPQQAYLATMLPTRLASLAGFSLIGGLAAALPLLSSSLANVLNFKTESTSSQIGKSWQESGSMELLDANAEACEQLLQQYISRLQTAKNGGWWRTAVYVVGEHDAVVDSVNGALRSLCSGDETSLDPMRIIQLPSYLVRSAVEHGQILDIQPAKGEQGHPLGSTYNSLATCISSKELSIIVNLPQQEIPGLPMREQGTFALSVPPATHDSITLGILQDNLGRDLEPVTITSAALNRHVFITGLTGYGKTNTCMQILLEAHTKLGVPFLVLEPAKAEYRRLGQIEGLKLRVYAIGDDSALPLRLNPFSPVSGVPLGRHIDLLKAVFNASFPMFAGMSYVLEEALLEVYTDRGWNIFTSHNPFLTNKSTFDDRSALTPSLEDLHDKIDTVLARKNYGQEVHRNIGAALRSRLRSLMVGNKGLTLNARRSTPMEDLFKAPAVIELRNLGDDEEKSFVMALLFVLLYEYAEVRQEFLPVEKRERLQHLTLVEEAHRLLQAVRGPASGEEGNPRAKAVSMFTDMLAEMRAYGEGFLVADQIPTKLAPETLKNSNLKILHRLVAPDDRQAAGSCINLTEQQMRYLNNLSRGLAIVHDDRIGEAVRVRIHPVKDTKARDRTQDELRVINKAVATMDQRYLHRHSGCRFCPSPCNFVHKLSGAASEEQDMLYLFLEGLFIDDDSQCWGAWVNWRKRLIGNAAEDTANEVSVSRGLVYCAATQGMYEWLGQILSAKNEEKSDVGQIIPPNRLKREAIGRVYGEFAWRWAQKSTLDDECVQAIIVLRDELKKSCGEVIFKEVRRKRLANSCQRAKRAYRQAANASDQNKLLRIVAKTHSEFASLCHQEKRVPAAQAAFKESLSAYRTLAGESSSYLPEVARTLNNLAGLALDLNEVEQAQEWGRQALSIRQPLWKKNPGMYSDALAWSLRTEARILKRKGKPEAGLEKIRNAIEIASDAKLKAELQASLTTWTQESNGGV